MKPLFNEGSRYYVRLVGMLLAGTQAIRSLVLRISRKGLDAEIYTVTPCGSGRA